MSKIAFLGTGAWGTALANVLLENKHQVLMWGIDEQEIDDLNHQSNNKYYPNRKLNGNLICATQDLEKLTNFKPNYIVIAVPSIFIADTLKKLLPLLKNKPVFINVAKGFDKSTKKTWSLTINKLIANKSSGLVTLIGPSFAIEVFNKQITIVNVLSNNLAIAKKVGKLFTNSYFKCIPCNDVIGGETISALKNVMAIASGILFSQHTSINTRSAVLAQMTKEISEVVKALKGNIETVYQFCGVGDIILTCTDPKSRNFSFGLKVGKDGFNNIQKHLQNHTVEGYWATLTAYEIIKKHHLKAPIITHLYKILYKGANEKTFINDVFKSIKS